jgi:hypothetical protein
MRWGGWLDIGSKPEAGRSWRRLSAEGRGAAGLPAPEMIKGAAAVARVAAP